MHRLRTWFRLSAVAVFPALAGCDSVLDVENPGQIPDEQLNSTEAVPKLVVGMSYDLTDAIDDILELTSLASGELWHGGSYDWADVPRGIILPEDVNDGWQDMQQARWTAEHGIARIDSIFQQTEDPERFDNSRDVARAYLLAGFANRTLGENVCSTTIDGGEEQPHTIHFDRAFDEFSEAIRVGANVGGDADDIVQAAYAGRASINAWRGDWAAAAADAQMVDPDFQYVTYFHTPDPDNILYYETYERPEYTVFLTEFEDHPDDARAPWSIIYDDDGTVAEGANGSTPFYQQEKYTTRGADVPLVKGAEMLVLRAEAALRNADVGGAVALMNEARAVYDMGPLSPAPTTLDEAWDVLHYERGATLWLETRRLWDLRRWNAETGPAHHSFLDERDQCIPISEDERLANPNIPE